MDGSLKEKTTKKAKKITDKAKKSAKSVTMLPKSLTDIAPLSTKSAKFERERILSLINSMTDGVIAVDDRLRISLYNAAALNILDLNISLEKKSISDVLKLIDSKGNSVDIESFIADTKTQNTSRDFRITYPDGSNLNLYVSAASINMGFRLGGKNGFVLILRDITYEKSLEEERDEFISVVSHELRTPIAIAEGNISNAELIADKSSIKGTIRDALKQAHNQIIFLGGLINDLSTLSRAERGKLNVDVEPINAHELVHELAQNYQPEAKSKGLEIKVDADPHLNLLYSSKLYVREILQNFITNAIKYTEKGSVHITAANTKNGVNFEISDTGIGIAKTDQQKIFDKFFRSEDYRTRANNGTGLGLYVTMKLARILKAEISIDSKLNEGSTFNIEIPSLKNSD